ncbi:hypothetical protein QBC35DRAFT_518169 [Podospora australis]|uniref:VWFA domain-containing protein n=1 Tax=Podospora australis TaxID=1536484 RepID=A0AAN7AF34_9PEZI|nr:hypothetical protein QBC35DRAFT_518169 [Podospora australis]
MSPHNTTPTAKPGSTPTSSVPGSSWTLDFVKVSASGASQTTSSRERIRQVEQENCKLRRMLAEADKIANRLKEEGESKTTLSADRILRFERDITATTNAAPNNQHHAGLFKTACSTDLLFLMDATGSMQPWIDAAKQQVKAIVHDIKSTFFNETDLRVAIVAYRDHRDVPKIQDIDFESDFDIVIKFLDAVRAGGGDDGAEDVLGGLQHAIGLSWKHKTKCIVHIADAPAHDNNLNDFSSNALDFYLSPGSEPQGLRYEVLLRELVQKDINYALLRINFTTDRMAFEFAKIYAEKSVNCQLLKTNQYFHSFDMVMEQKKNLQRCSDNGGVQFQELQLASSLGKIRHLVCKTVTNSATLSAARLLSPPVPSPGRPFGISPRGGPVQSPRLLLSAEQVPPQWDVAHWFQETFAFEAYSVDVFPGDMGELEPKIQSLKIQTTDLTIVSRSRPFANGAIRTAFYARTKGTMNRLVVKSLMRTSRSTHELAGDMRIQAIAKMFAQDFNAHVMAPQHSLDFPYLGENYVKYNNNTGWVNHKLDPLDIPTNEAAQVFSHFSFERSSGMMLICDLRGVGQLLTDPAIHTREPGNQECSSDICQKLGLKSTRETIMSNSCGSGHDDFRTDWEKPDWDALVRSNSIMMCCSNKLCGTLLSLNSDTLTTTGKFWDVPGSDRFYWCGPCFEQVKKTTSKICCDRTSPTHVFSVSRFSTNHRARTCRRNVLHIAEFGHHLHEVR